MVQAVDSHSFRPNDLKQFTLLTTLPNEYPGFYLFIVNAKWSYWLGISCIKVLPGATFNICTPLHMANNSFLLIFKKKNSPHSREQEPFLVIE